MGIDSNVPWQFQKSLSSPGPATVISLYFVIILLGVASIAFETDVDPDARDFTVKLLIALLLFSYGFIVMTSRVSFLYRQGIAGNHTAQPPFQAGNFGRGRDTDLHWVNTDSIRAEIADQGWSEIQQHCPFLSSEAELNSADLHDHMICVEGTWGPCRDEMSCDFMHYRFAGTIGRGNLWDVAVLILSFIVWIVLFWSVFLYKNTNWMSSSMQRMATRAGKEIRYDVKVMKQAIARSRVDDEGDSSPPPSPPDTSSASSSLQSLDSIFLDVAVYAVYAFIVFQQTLSMLPATHIEVNHFCASLDVPTSNRHGICLFRYASVSIPMIVLHWLGAAICIFAMSMFNEDVPALALLIGLGAAYCIFMLLSFLVYYLVGGVVIGIWFQFHNLRTWTDLTTVKMLAMPASGSAPLVIRVLFGVLMRYPVEIAKFFRCEEWCFRGKVHPQPDEQTGAHRGFSAHLDNSVLQVRQPAQAWLESPPTDSLNRPRSA